MSPTFRCFIAPCAIAFVLASSGATEGQIIRYGRFGGVGGWDGLKIRTPSVSIGVSPWGETTVRTPFGTRHWSAAPPVPYHASPRLAPRSPAPFFPGPEGYTSPQDRYTMPPRPYGAAPPPRSPYSLGAPSTSDGQRAEPKTTRPLPFARSPYDAGSAEGFGVTGAAPAPSLSDRELTNALVRAASELDEALAAQQDGDIWQEYLQPTTIAEAFRSTGATAVDEESLRRLLINFDATTGNPELRWVTEIDGFAPTRQLLNEWLRRQSADDEADQETKAGREIIEAEELPAPAAEPPQGEPPRRYEL